MTCLDMFWSRLKNYFSSRKYSLIVGLFILLPIIVCGAWEYHRFLQSSNYYQEAKYFALRILQDVLVGALVWGGVGFCLRPHVVSRWRKVCVGILLLLGLVIPLWDALVLTYTDVRMDNEFWRFLFTPDVFWTMARAAYDLSPLVIVGGVFIVYLLLLWFSAVRQQNSFKIRYRYWIAYILLVGSALILTLPLFSFNAFKLYGNSIVKILFEDVFMRVSNSTIATTSIAASSSGNDKAPAGRFPFYKEIDKFVGPRQFEISVTPDNEPQHVIFLFLESFRGVNVGLLKKGGADFSPRFNQLAQSGVLFTNCYSAGIRTPVGATATLFGVRSSTLSLEISPDLKLWGLPQFFQSKNYVTAYFSGSSAAICDHKKFFLEHGFNEVFSREDIQPLIKCRTNSPFGIYDHDLLNFYLSWLSAADRKKLKTFSAVFTINNHLPFHMPDAPITDRITFQELRERFRNTMRYTDECIFQLVSTLRKIGMDKKCLIVILADHGYNIADHEPNAMNNSVYEEEVAIPLLILAPGRLKQPKVITDVCSQVDIMPTFLDLFQAAPIRCPVMGRSLLRPGTEAATAYFNTSGTVQTAGLRRGNYKYIHNFANGKDELYDLSTDLYEAKNLAAQKPDLVRSLFNELRTAEKLIDYATINNSFVPPGQ